MKKSSLSNFIGASLMPVVLSGCSLGKTYSEIDPEGAKEDIRKHTGYYALKSVEPGAAKLVLRSGGSGHAVQYSTSTAATACEGLEKQGTVRDTGRGVVYPWIASLTLGMSRSQAFLEQDLEQPSSVQVQGYASLVDRTLSTTRLGHCGPLTVRFKPQADHAYLVRFLFESGQCQMEVTDATDPDAPAPVPFEALPNCPKS